jgi:hypothetical protein
MRLYQDRWDDLIGSMPAKLVYPAVAGKEWIFMTGSDPKNVPWSYHNGGNWPVLISGLRCRGHEDRPRRPRPAGAGRRRPRLPSHRWPEYYDGRAATSSAGAPT